MNGIMTVQYDPAKIGPSSLIHKIAEKAGMRAEVVGGASETGPKPSPSSLSRWGPTVGSGLLLAVGMAIDAAGGPAPASRLVLAGSALIGAVGLVPRALRSIRSFRLDIHVLMAVAVVGAAALGQLDEAATIAFLFGLSEALEALSLDRARRAVRALLEIAPETAERIGPDGSTRVVPAADLVAGDRVRVRAGERVPIDGRVVSGRSSLDQKAITGESVPVDRGPGDPVFAGTVNGEGSLEVEAGAPLNESVVSRIAEGVRSAQKGRAPVERTIERFAAVYTPAVLIVAMAVMLGPPLLGASGGWREWFLRGLVVLVIACPCALVIATPVAVVAALAAAARRGILVKGGQFLEEVGRLRVLAFDKTGTLTRGEPSVVEVVPEEGRPGDDLLKIAAALGDLGGHVLGRAIARHAREHSLAIPEAGDYRAVPGLGATATVDSSRYHVGSHRFLDESGLCPPEFHARLVRAENDSGTAVAVAGEAGAWGWIRLADRPRPEAAKVLADLAALGIEAVMLTGDNAPTAAAVAEELGIADRRSGLLPQDKALAIAEIQRRRGPTGMVGDGVNDAPALAEARVSVALGGISSATALETADVVLMADDLTGLPWLVRLGRRTLRTIRQNIVLALSTKAAVLVLAVLGVANLWMAIAADVGVSLLVVANALRLLRARQA